MPRSLSNQPAPEDQRNVIIATILFGVVMLGWMYWFNPQPPQPPQQPFQDTTAAAQAPAPQAAPSDTAAPAAATASRDTAALAPATNQPLPDTARTIVVETPLYEAVLSSQGGTLRRFALKDYHQYGQQQNPVQLIDSTGRGALALSFTTPQSRLVDTRDVHFTSAFAGDTLRITEQEATLTFTATLSGGTLHQTYTFRPSSYDVGLAIRHENADRYLTRDGYALVWDDAMPFSEDETEGELRHTGLFAYSGGEVVGLALSDQDHNERSLNGDIGWVATKNKYFTAAVLPDAPDAVKGADLIGDRVQHDGSIDTKSLTARLQLPAPTPAEPTDQFNLYLGPINYYNLASYNRDLYDMVDYGWDFFEWMTRPLAKYIFIPVLTYLGGVLPNYGLALIIIALLVKLLTYPLTRSSYRSMAQMRELQPKMEEIKDKYGDDPQKQQEEMMKMYRETGVNPIGGCLPMFLQYPVLIALYQFIPQSIQLRQESFLWAADLSAPDVILQLPFTLPFYGDYVSGFTLLMALSMIATMRLQSSPGAGGGQMKAMMYGMPIFFLFIFNGFASGLSLYYLAFNIVSVAQQQYINHEIEQEKDDPSTNGRGSRKDAKKGFFAKLIEKAEEAQKRQQS